MSSHFPENPITTRRECLGFLAAAVLSPLAARAAGPCPCGVIDPVASPSKGAAENEPSAVLRVCADPHNLPFSNRNHEGFEDKVAELIARELGSRLEFDWLPQRLGFYRTALKTFDSQLVMAAPAGFEKALITDPYYKSTYVFVSRPDSKPSGMDDPALRTMKIGVQLNGGDTPATHALAARKIIDNVHGFPAFDESTGTPAQKIVAAVASGEIDVAIVWGPQAGFFVKRQTVALVMTAVTPQQDGHGPGSMPFTFSICVGVRRSESKLRDRINQVISRRRREIDGILDEFSVPRLPLDPVRARAGKDR
jgi:mxaJ protein